MTLEQLKSALLLKPSYFKESYLTIANRFNVSVSLVKSVFENEEVQAARKRYNSKKITDFLKVQADSLISSELTLPKGRINSDQHKLRDGIHIVLSCLHVPFENKKLIKSIGGFLEDYADRIAGFHLIGDFLDLRSLSFHDRGHIPMYGITLGYEYKRGNALLDYFDALLLPGVQKSYLYGNHEDRHTRLGALTDVNQYIDALPSPAQALRLKERGYLVKDNWKEDYVQLGHLQLIHGIFCTQTPAKTHLGRIKSSVMFGHTHRLDSYYEADHGAFNIGCLVDMDSEAFDYLSRVERMNWKNGFGLVHLDKDGTFQADIINCQDNRFYYAGVKY